MEGKHKWHFYDLIMNCCDTLWRESGRRKMDPTRDYHLFLLSSSMKKMFYVKIKCECEFSGGDCPRDELHIGVNDCIKMNERGV